ncbi:MAG TPA: substrate-binding domain-containing protein, partial [Abditibacteriaceae bacterium]
MKTKSVLGLIVLPVLVAGSVLFAGCGGQNNADNSANATSGNTAGGDAASTEKLSGAVKSDGSSTVGPISSAMAEEFGATQPGVRATVGISGTGAGLKKFASGELDIANASRPIKSKEAAAAKAKGVDFIELPVAYDGL